MASDPQLREEVMSVMSTRFGVFGEDQGDLIEYLGVKIESDCSKGALKRAVNSLLFQGKLKRARLGAHLGYLASFPDFEDPRVILYVEGVPDTEFPEEFKEFIGYNDRMRYL